LNSIRKVLGSLFCSPLNKGKFQSQLIIFYTFLIWLFFGFFWNLILFHMITKTWIVHKRWGKKTFIKLHYSNHENSSKVFIKSWWKSFLGILVNLIFNLLHVKNITFIRLLSIHYYLVIIANHFTIWVHYVCYVFTTFGSCVSIDFLDSATFDAHFKYNL